MFLDCNFHLITQFPKTSFFIFGCFLCQERNKCPVQNKRPPLNYRKFVSPPAAKSNHYGILKSCNIMIHCQCALVYRTTGEQAVDYRSVRIKITGHTCGFQFCWWTVTKYSAHYLRHVNWRIITVLITINAITTKFYVTWSETRLQRFVKLKSPLLPRIERVVNFIITIEKTKFWLWLWWPVDFPTVEVRWLSWVSDVTVMQIYTRYISPMAEKGKLFEFSFQWASSPGICFYAYFQFKGKFRSQSRLYIYNDMADLSILIRVDVV